MKRQTLAFDGRHGGRRNDKENGKKYKFQCELCKETFDNDYRSGQNKKYHSDCVKSERPIPFLTTSAQLNPFTVKTKTRARSSEMPAVATAWKVFKYRVFFCSVFSPTTGKYGPGKTPYLDPFHAVYRDNLIILHDINLKHLCKFCLIKIISNKFPVDASKVRLVTHSYV